MDTTDKVPICKQIMKALILAAGRGRRLWPFTAERPKCLLEVGGITLLERQLHNLRAAGLQRIVVVCGFGVEKIRSVVDALPFADVKLLYNPFYAISDNLISLWVARSEMDEDLILLNGDNIFHPGSVQALLQQRAPCSLLAARKARYADDDMKLYLDGECVSHIGKSLDCRRTDAESLGMLSFRDRGAAALRQALEQIVLNDSALSSHFPSVIQHMIDTGQPFTSCFARPFACSDVDTPADLARVRSELHRYCEATPSLAQAEGSA